MCRIGYVRLGAGLVRHSTVFSCAGRVSLGRVRLRFSIVLFRFSRVRLSIGGVESGEVKVMFGADMLCHGMAHWC